MHQSRLALLDQPDRLRMALSPIRRRLLARLQQPGSATQIAAELDLPRQLVNYHVRALEQVGLLALVEQRPRRGCTERILVASARAFIVDPGVMTGKGAAVPAATAAQDRFAAEHLVTSAAGIVRDVTRMQARAHRQGQRLVTFTLDAEVSFATPADLERFTAMFATLLTRAAADYPPAPGARRYRLVVGGHPAARRAGPHARTSA